MLFDIDHHWFEALHVIAATAWMVGMFYLPRLYVYHAGLKPDSEAYELLKTMEKKLLNYIMTPAMVVTISIGLFLAFHTGHLYSAWLHVKLLFVGMMILLHLFFWTCKERFRTNCNTHTPKFYKIVNESVTVLFSIIVILAFVKPF